MSRGSCGKITARWAPGRANEALLRTVMRHRSGLSIVNMEGDLDTADDAAGYGASRTSIRGWCRTTSVR